jgi:2-phospho-L-lactate guanylyltransferase
VSVWAVVPVKGFERAKSRLTNLDPAQRSGLARRMFEHVIGAISECELIGGIIVVTDSDDVAEAARLRGARIVRDGPTTGVGPAVAAALVTAAELGAQSAIVLMSDLPRLTVADLRELTGVMHQHPVVIVPDRRDRGTNALGLTPPNRMPTRFGNEDSFELHCLEAHQRGERFRVHRNPRIAFDVDLPADLANLGGARVAGAR